MGTPVSERERCLCCLERDVEASLEGLEYVHGLLDEFWQQIQQVPVRQPDATWKALFASATAEVAGNVIRHAYPESEPDTFFRFSLSCYTDRLVATLTDHGIPCMVMPEPRSPDMRITLDDPDLDHGWGLPIAHAASDALDYQRLDNGYNRWQIDKYLPS